MTGFARSQGEVQGVAWVWELRSVNGKGLDVKLRLPAGMDALEPGLREAAGQAMRRGNVSGTLSLRREAVSGLTADLAALERVKELAIELSDNIPGALPPRAELLLALPGVMRQVNAQDDSEAMQAEVQAAVKAGFMTALAGLQAARAAEGARLAVVMAAQIAEIAELQARATAAAATQPALHLARLRQQLSELLGTVPAPPEERLAQEIALLATRSDVREELDRLAAHVAAAQGLLAEGMAQNVAVGRRLDFLMQEFNREANTLCSKSASVELTNIGMALKVVIEQLREQVQNIE